MEIWMLVAIVVFVLVLAYALYRRFGLRYYTAMEIKALDDAELAKLGRNLTAFEKEMVKALNAQIVIRDELVKQLESSKTPEEKKKQLQRVKEIANVIATQDALLSTPAYKGTDAKIIKRLEQLKKWARWQEKALNQMGVYI